MTASLLLSKLRWALDVDPVPLGLLVSPYIRILTAHKIVLTCFTCLVKKIFRLQEKIFWFSCNMAKTHQKQGLHRLQFLVAGFSMEDATYLDVFERLKIAANTTSDQELAVRLGLSKQSIADARSRKTVPPAWIPKAAQLFGVSTDWLFFGGQHLDAPENAGSAPACCDVDLIMVPMVEARLSAGTGSLQVDGDVERSYAFRSDFLHRKGSPANMVMMRVEGDSMQPEIMNADVVLLDQSKKEIRAGRIFAVGFDDAIYLKRIDKLPGKIILKSVNPEYPPVELDVREQAADAFRVIGQVIWCGREYK